MKYAAISPIQTGWAEMPISTSVIVSRSSSDRGRSADRMPAGIETSSQAIMPPKTSDAVTGAARSTTSFTLRRFVNDRPSEWCTTRRSRNFAYRT